MKPFLGRIATGKKSMPYMRCGTGAKPFVILLGMSMFPVTQTAEAVATRFSNLAEEYTMYLFDRAEPVTEGVTVENMADETAAAMEFLGLSHADIYGASQGGMIALALAARYPHLVRKLVLASTAAYCTDEEKSVFLRWSQLGRTGDAPALNRDAFGKIYSAEYRKKFADAFRFAETLGTEKECLRFARLAEACMRFDARPFLPEIHCPAFVVSGENDVIFHNSASFLTSALQGTLYLYPNGSYAVYDEADDFIERISAFLCR